MAATFDMENRVMRLGNATAKVYIRMVDGLPQPWFQAKPIALHLGYAVGNVSTRLGKLPEKHRKSLGELMEGDLAPRAPLEHNEKIATYVSEAGLFELLCKSEMPAARPFQDWLFEEVLPTIRRTGGYGLAPPPEQLAQAVDRAVANAMAQALPAILQTIADSSSHHIFEASHGGSSERDQAMLREVGRDAALERDAFLADGPVELGALLREQLDAGDQWKASAIKPRFAAEAKARALARHAEQGTRPWLVYSQGALRIAYTDADVEHLLLQFWEPETQDALARLVQGGGRGGGRLAVRSGPYQPSRTQRAISDFFGRAAGSSSGSASAGSSSSEAGQ
jgi:prophage antirepressor-like protein